MKKPVFTFLACLVAIILGMAYLGGWSATLCSLGGILCASALISVAAWGLGPACPPKESYVDLPRKDLQEERALPHRDPKSPEM